MYQQIPSDFSFLFFGPFAFALLIGIAAITEGLKDATEKQNKTTAIVCFTISTLLIPFLPMAWESAVRESDVMENNIKIKYESLYGDTGYLREVDNDGSNKTGDKFFNLMYSDGSSESVSVDFNARTGEPYWNKDLKHPNNHLK